MVKEEPINLELAEHISVLSGLGKLYVSDPLVEYYILYP